MYFAVTLGTYLFGWIVTFAVTERKRRGALRDGDDWRGFHEDPFLTATKWPVIAITFIVLAAFVLGAGAWQWLDDALKREGV